MKLNNATVVITGGAARLGRAVALEMAAAGCRLIIHYNRSADAAETLRERLLAAQVSVELIQADLADSVQRENFLQQLYNRPEPPRVLVNNAAIFFPTPLDSVTEEQWQQLENINVRAPFFIARGIGLRMRKAGEGRIIFIGDTGYRAPWPDYIPYLSGKGAVNTMTRGLARALAPQVLVNCVNPGPVLMPPDYSEEQKDKALRRTLLKRAGTPRDIARTVRFLAESDYITGASIPVDGGRHIG